MTKKPKGGPPEMPGGHVEEGETLREAAIWETKEESGIDIEIVKLCGIGQFD